MAFGDSLQATAATLRPDSRDGDDRKLQDALETVALLKTDFKPRDDIYAEIEKVIYLENAVNIPEAYRKTAIEVRSPYPVNIVNNITAALSINAPKYRIQAGRPGRVLPGQRRVA